MYIIVKKCVKINTKHRTIIDGWIAGCPEMAQVS